MKCEFCGVAVRVWKSTTTSKQPFVTCMLHRKLSTSLYYSKGGKFYLSKAGKRTAEATGIDKDTIMLYSEYPPPVDAVKASPIFLEKGTGTRTGGTTTNESISVAGYRSLLPEVSGGRIHDVSLNTTQVLQPARKAFIPSLGGENIRTGKDDPY